ncbi:hypothetical protein [Gramella sp. AN32]|uniref:Uncharacterized protein n=1 Tax=Christiangramia antarctica TaxID=2058158 RepID=A0ABW5X4N3_9FLAO|nr:hypothetical protein [Gramella sp. AN32]
MKGKDVIEILELFWHYTLISQTKWVIGKRKEAIHIIFEKTRHKKERVEMFLWSKRKY